MTLTIQEKIKELLESEKRVVALVKRYPDLAQACKTRIQAYETVLKVMEDEDAKLAQSDT